MSIFGILATPLSWLLTQVYGVIGNYGITLIIITVIVKGALYPVYKKQILSTAGMSDLQPKMKELQRRYANDKAVYNEKVQELYKSEGFNPMAGCLPMIVQMIVIMGLFALLRTPMAFVSSQEMYFAIHEPFLWIKDLSQPDLWVLPTLTGLATFAATWMNQMNNVSGQTNGMMKVMQYFFPIMMVLLVRSYPSGIGIYWTASQLIQILYNLRFNKIRKQIKEKNNPKKKKRKK